MPEAALEQPKQESKEIKSSSKADERQIDQALVAAEQQIEMIEGKKDAAVKEADEQKRLVINNVADQIAKLGLPEHKVGARVAKYFEGSKIISRSWIYDCLPDKYKDMNRSKEISEGRNAGKNDSMSSADNSTKNANGGNGDSGGVAPQGPLGSRNADRSLTVASMQTAINELISSARKVEGGMFISEKEWNRFTTVAARAQIPAQ